MNIRTEFEPSAGQKVYSISSSKRIGALVRYASLFVMCCASAAAVLLFSSPILVKLLLLPLFVLLGALMVFAYLWRTRVFLVISPAGISYQSASYCISTPWENVASIGMRVENNNEETRVTGLELRQPAPVFEIRPWLRFLLVDQPSLFIPLSYVVTDWQRGELAEDLHCYAPRLWGGV
jgi:hypothetical protein